ncbi:MAG TPA: hypothetical protein VHN98_10100 [Acidimicrobiales bacterium]|nr:hypothetical protein [Acidimicrobiales bacterium]
MSRARFLAGVVAGEGHFAHNVSKRAFRFAVALGATDRMTCELMLQFFGVGHVNEYPRRKEHYDDEVVFAVRRLTDLVAVIVPFMDDHLPASFKREQYEAWRADLLDYWEHRAKRRRPCTVDGCDEPQRAKGLCRRHYYLAHHA